MTANAKKDIAPRAGNPSSSSASSHGPMLFGQFLLAKGLISKDTLTSALVYQSQEGGRLGEILTRQGVLDDRVVLQALAEHLQMAYTDLNDMTKIDRTTARKLPEGIARRFCVLPIAVQEGRVRVVMADPVDVVAIDTVMLRLKQRIEPVLSSRARIAQAIETVFHGSDMEEQRLKDLIREEDRDEVLEDTVITVGGESSVAVAGEEGVNDAPVVRFVDLMLRQAVKSQASDIHIEPQDQDMLIRMRVDGKLRHMVPPPKKMQTAVVARIKILSKMNIAERRLPQDGRMKIQVSQRDIDVRVSAIPTIYGEKIVMLILDAEATCHDLDHLGFDCEKLAQFKETLNLPHGIIVVTGPTGSGKTTTLYAALNYLKDPAENLTTVEDPVEYRLQGINQIQVKPEIGLDFAVCLRSILRQDPDTILIGEIRDKETVDIAIKASLTGHLVLSTFHTNDAPSAISRMCYMGIERYLLASTLNLVVAQRLVRRICEHCKEPMSVKAPVLRRLGLDPKTTDVSSICQGRGCSACVQTGYKGRMPIFEFLPVDDDMADLIVSDANESRIRSLARSKGGGSLLDSGIQRVLQGQTTVEEVLSVAYTGRSQSLGIGIPETQLTVS